MCITTTRRRSLTFSNFSKKIAPSDLKKESVKLPKYEPDPVKSYTKPFTPDSCDVILPKQEGNKNQKLVTHNYHDHSSEYDSSNLAEKQASKGGVTIPFPIKLFDMLSNIEKDNMSHIVSWQPHGRCFVVHMPKLFVEHVMPKYFQQKKYASFQRQLNLYGFSRLTKGCDKGGYYHELFLRGKRFLVSRIHRMKVKGTGARMASNPDAEPNFYAMKPAIEKSLRHTESNAIKNRDRLSPKEPRHVVSCNTSVVNAGESQEKPNIIYFEGMPLHYLDPESSNFDFQFEAHSNVPEPMPLSDSTDNMSQSPEVIQCPVIFNISFVKNDNLARTVSDNEEDSESSLEFLSELDKLFELGNEPLEDDEFINFIDNLHEI